MRDKFTILSKLLFQDHLRINCGLVEEAAPQLKNRDLQLILSPRGTFVSRAQFIRAVCSSNIDRG